MGDISGTGSASGYGPIYNRDIGVEKTVKKQGPFPPQNEILEKIKEFQNRLEQFRFIHWSKYDQPPNYQDVKALYDEMMKYKKIIQSSTLTESQKYEFELATDRLSQISNYKTKTDYFGFVINQVASGIQAVKFSMTQNPPLSDLQTHALSSIFDLEKNMEDIKKFYNSPHSERDFLEWSAYMGTACATLSDLYPPETYPYEPKTFDTIKDLIQGKIFQRYAPDGCGRIIFPISIYYIPKDFSIDKLLNESHDILDKLKDLVLNSPN